MMADAAALKTGGEKRPLRLNAPHGRAPRLLLAEDCDPVRIVTAAMLKGMGCEVEAVIHGEQAVKSASESLFDVIVLDIEMPIMDGIAAARAIRRMGGAAAATPLMALSAFLADSVRTGDWRDTFDIALPKPANRNELHQAVQSALARGPERHETAELPPLLEEPRYSALRTGLAASVWRQLSDAACRDIEVCLNQIGDGKARLKDGALLVLAAKLRDLGRAFAAGRLAWAAGHVQDACSEQARAEAMGVLVDSARETVRLLRT